MLFSVLSIMPAFAYATDYETLWTQDFENTSDKNMSDGGTWDGIGGTCAANLKENGNQGGNIGNYIHFSQNADTTSDKTIGVKVFVDQTKCNYTIDKKYIVKADVYVKADAATDATTLPVRISFFKGTDHSQPCGFNTVTVNCGAWAEVSSPELLLTADHFENGLNVRIDSTKATRTGSTKTIVYVDNVRIVEVKPNYFKNDEGAKISTTADAGYYAETFDADEKTGAISFSAYISDNASAVANYESFGMYVYRADDEDNKHDVVSQNKVELANAEGFVNVVVEEINEAFFDEKVLVVPYVVVGGITYLGDVFTYSVNQAGENLKWLGAKTE